MSRIKRWNGSKWVDNLPKRWNGSKWVDAVIRRWNGSKWEIISEQEYTTTWNATWTASFNGSSTSKITSRVAKWGDTVSHYALWWGATWNQIVNWNGLRSPHIIYAGTRYIVQKGSLPRKRNSSGWMYQGQYTPSSKFDDRRGRQRSMIGFNHSDMRNKMKGAKIVKVEMYLRSKHFYSTSGGSAVIGYHNASSNPSSFSEVKYNSKTQSYTKRNQGRWITLPKSVGEAIRDNKAKGITLNTNSTSTSRYGYFYGRGNGSEPKLRITYKK